jgi:DNA (cytosine-5)-methyltransferase 1
MPATDLCHPTLDRPLSIEEYKRIQEFPDNWKLSGNLIQQYKQIGNAVPVSLGVAIGKLIADHIYGNKIIQLKNFRYSRYLKTSDLDWHQDTKKISFNF